MTRASVNHVDVALYVMTPEFGAPSQLEKIDMLDFADAIAINKFERRGAQDARRDVARQVLRNRAEFGASWEDMPVFGTSAARFDDDGVTALYQYLKELLTERGLPEFDSRLPTVATKTSTDVASVLPRGRERYLAEIAERVRGYRVRTAEQVEAVRDWDHVRHTNALVGTLNDLEADKAAMIDPDVRAALDNWPSTRQAYSGPELVYTVRGRDIHTPLTRETLSGSLVRRVALPPDDEPGAVVRFLRSENLPGYFPFTAGVFPVKRSGEAPARMFAGEGDPARTNRRFHLLSEGQPATRLSTAFDSVTLYGRDPSPRLDVYGKVGTSGVSVATIEDMRDLYAGFDLCSPTTSVSMTINGPAPAILAMFLNVAIDQQLAAHPDEDPENVRARTLTSVRGTVQADILKEDQGQNTCIFSTEFALRAMADMQQWFIDQDVRELLLGVDQRLPHRGGGRQSDQPAGVHPGQRFHLRRGLPCPRDGRRRLRPEPVLLLLQRHGCRVHGAGPGGPAHLGDRHAGSVWRRRACPETQVPRADVGTLPACPGDVVQRHPDDAAGAVRPL